MTDPRAPGAASVERLHRRRNPRTFLERCCRLLRPPEPLVLNPREAIDAPLDAARTAWFVGDTEGDIKTGRNAGGSTVFTLSGREDQDYMNRWDVRPDHIVEDLYDAVELILSQDSHPSRQRGGGAPQGR